MYVSIVCDRTEQTLGQKLRGSKAAWIEAAHGNSRLLCHVVTACIAHTISRHVFEVQTCVAAARAANGHMCGIQPFALRHVLHPTIFRQTIFRTK